MLEVALNMPRVVAGGLIRHLQMVEQMIRAGSQISLPKVTDGLRSFRSIVDVFA